MFIQNQELQEGTAQIHTQINSANLNNISFITLVKFFQKLSQLRGSKKSQFVKIFCQAIFKTSRNPHFTYSIIRLILPAEDRERGNYGIKEKMLCGLISDALSLSKQNYERMKHYKNPSYHPEDAPVGDFPSVVYTIINGFCGNQPKIKVEQINNILQKLISAKERKEQSLIFTEILKKCTAQQIKWLLRIILKDIKLGIKEEVVLKTFHPDAHQYYNLTNSLKLVCIKFQFQQKRLSNQLLLFHPIKPMLAAKKQFQFFKNIHKPFLFQTKYDGERLQVHYTKQKTILFSRNGNNYSHIYKGILPYLSQSLICQGCILDCQIIVVQYTNRDKTQYKKVQFGMNKTVALRGQDQYGLCLKIFDLLWLKRKGQEINFMGYQLHKRKNLLSQIIKQIPSKIQLTHSQQVTSFEQIQQKFNQAIEMNQEGIILKDPLSYYLPKDRSGAWIKLKGDYINGLTDTLDLIIIGGYFGDSHSYRIGNTGEWTDYITRFLLGVIDLVDQKNPNNSKIIPFCKVGTGYSGQQLDSLRMKLKSSWIRQDGRKPLYLVGNWKPNLQDRPDCWIDNLKNSYLLQIKSAELIKSEVFGYPMTLRFPRVIRIRYDKQWYECLNVKELDNLIDQDKYTKNLKRKNIQESDQEQNDQQKKKSKKKKQKSPSQMIHKQVQAWNTLAYLETLPIISGIFFNLQFCLIGIEIPEKQKIEAAIYQNSGKVSQNPLISTTHIVSNKVDFKIRNIFNKNTENVEEQNNFPIRFIKPQWIFASVQDGQVHDLSPHYVLIPSYDLVQKFSKDYDIYGDHFTNQINRRDLLLILQSMNQPFPQHLNQYKKEIIRKLCKKGRLQGLKISVECQGIQKLQLIIRIKLENGQISNGLQADIVINGNRENGLSMKQFISMYLQ